MASNSGSSRPGDVPDTNDRGGQDEDQQQPFRRDQRSTTPRFMRSLLSRRSVLWQGLILRSLNDPLPSWAHSSILLLLRVKLLEQRLTKLVASGSVKSDGTTSVKLQVNLKT